MTIEQSLKLLAEEQLKSMELRELERIARKYNVIIDPRLGVIVLGR